MTRNRKIAGGTVLVGIGLMAFAFVDSARAEVASFYRGSDGLDGNLTASGEVFDSSKLTAAHRTLPLGSKVWVSNGSKSVQVTINDRGPYTPGKDIDLSRAAAQTLGISGVGPVKIDAADVSDEIEKPKEKPKELPKTGGVGQ